MATSLIGPAKKFLDLFTFRVDNTYWHPNLKGYLE